MKITKKIMSVVLAAVMVIGALAMSVSAASLADGAKSASSGKKYSCDFDELEGTNTYKLVLSKKGNIEINFTFQISTGTIQLFDSNGNSIKPSSVDMSAGKNTYWSSLYTKDEKGNRINLGYSTVLKWNEGFEKSSGKITYKGMAKGTYYVRIGNEYDYKGNGKASWSFTYPSAKKDESSDSGKISYLTLEMEAGDTLRLGAVAEPADAEIKWTSSKTNVATVSASGKVTAKKEGSTIITAKSGSSSVKIKINVV